MTRQRIQRMIVLATVLLGMVSLPALAAKVVWEAEVGTIANGTGFLIGKKQVDPGGGASQDYVVYIPYPQNLKEGEKVPPPAEDSVTYKVNIPMDGTYYLWARTRWSGITSFRLTIKDMDDANWVLGGDAIMDMLHWVVLGGTSETAIKLKLTKGVTTFVLYSREYGAMVDQFILTTDAKWNPAGTYKPTKNGLAE